MSSRAIRPNPGAGEKNAKYIIWRVADTPEVRKIIDFFLPEWYAMENIEEIEIDTMVNGKKIYYSISEVCTQAGLEPHVLRYWESEFSQLRPKKNRAGNRAYRDKDIEVIRFIKNICSMRKSSPSRAPRKNLRNYVLSMEKRCSPIRYPGRCRKTAMPER